VKKGPHPERRDRQGPDLSHCHRVFLYSHAIDTNCQECLEGTSEDRGEEGRAQIEENKESFQVPDDVCSLTEHYPTASDRRCAGPLVESWLNHIPLFSF